MKNVLIAGGSGLIGRCLSKMLQESGYQVGVLSRSDKCDSDLKFHKWNPEKAEIDKSVLNYNYIINLAGAGIADRRWSTKRKQEILNSRVNSTVLLAKTFSDADQKLNAVVSASAIGYYGHSGEVLLTEKSLPQTNEFLSEVCKSWEKSADAFNDVTDNLSILRIGTVLSGDGGALPKMAIGIRMGMANYLGRGNQWISWVHIDDICRTIIFLLDSEQDGVFNGVSPHPVTNKYFTKALRRAVNRYSLFMPVPEFVIRLIFGELANLVLNSNKVSASKLVDTGFEFKYPQIEEALESLL